VRERYESTAKKQKIKGEALCLQRAKVLIYYNFIRREQFSRTSEDEEEETGKLKLLLFSCCSSVLIKYIFICSFTQLLSSFF